MNKLPGYHFFVVNLVDFVLNCVSEYFEKSQCEDTALPWKQSFSLSTEYSKCNVRQQTSSKSFFLCIKLKSILKLANSPLKQSVKKK